MTEAVTRPKRPKRASNRVPRAELVLSAAARLFYERGFHSVGIDEIGAAAGITGSGVYRHFRSKDDVLVALLNRATERFLSGAERIVDQAPSAEAALEQLVRFHLGVVLEEPSLVAVYFQEARAVPRQASRALSRRRRLYVEHWCAVVAELDGRLSEQLLRVVVNGALNLLNSAALYGNESNKTQVEEILVPMALAAFKESIRGATGSSWSPEVEGTRLGGIGL